MAQLQGLHITDIETKFGEYIHSTQPNGLIWAPTQVGKSEAIIKFIETSFRCNAPVVVSNDNKTDQCEQLYRRILKRLCGADVDVMCVKEKRFEQMFKTAVLSGKKRFVIFVMNNATQLKKLMDAFRAVVIGSRQLRGAFLGITRMSIIHDEADTITKHNDVNTITDTQPASHSAWLEFMEMCEDHMTHVVWKRVFVTATPENCCLMYNITSSAVFALQIPETYRGYKDIHYVGMNDDIDIYGTLRREVSRIQAAGTFEVILYCIERKTHQGHAVVMDRMHDELNCTVSTYNGNGIGVVFKTDELCEMFEDIIDIYNDDKCKFDKKAKQLTYTRNNMMFHVKDLPISDFYTMCKAIGENCVVTIGMDLIARGISYVGRDRKEPLTASTMLYKPGATMHGVGITQAVGRITGTAMPELQRRLYAPHDVINTYKAFNLNQEKYIKKIATSIDTLDVKHVIDSLEFCKLPRKIDRPKLKLRMNMTHEYSSDLEEDLETTVTSTASSDADMSCSSSVGSDEDEDSENEDTDTVLLVRRYWGTNTFAGIVMRLAYDNDGRVSEEELYRELVNFKIMTNLKALQKKECKCVFSVRKGVVSLTQDAMQCIREIK